MCACRDAKIGHFGVCVDVQEVETFDFWRFLGVLTAFLMFGG